MTRAIVLGRFQPFHKGHAYLVMQAALVHPSQPVMVAIGSAKKEWEPDNPWSAGMPRCVATEFRAGGYSF